MSNNFNRGGFSPRSRFGEAGARRGNSRGPSRTFHRGGNHRAPQGNRGRANNGGHIDVNRFIHKAEGATTVANENYVPQNSFDTFHLSPELVQNIKSKGYLIPTPIQDQAILPIMEGRDIIGLANTGTGKTAAFLIPMIEKVFKNKNERVFIVAPTRELALQINEELKTFAQGMGIYSALLIGGANISRQVSDLYRNPHFVIGTPGRIKDLIQRNVLKLYNFQNIILDEVDLMVDIGFIRDVEFFISMLSRQRQSLFFSATINSKVDSVLRSFVTNPITISVKTGETADLVNQDVIRVINKDKKVDQLHELLITEGFDKVLVFGRTKWNVERLTRELAGRGFKVGAIHGNKTQGARQRIIREFKANQIQVLLATDVASRGLDIENVTHVINYDIPESYDDYVHRIGRTGRAGKTGIALTFI